MSYAQGDTSGQNKDNSSIPDSILSHPDFSSTSGASDSTQDPSESTTKPNADVSIGGSDSQHTMSDSLEVLTVDVESTTSDGGHFREFRAGNQIVGQTTDDDPGIMVAIDKGSTASPISNNSFGSGLSNGGNSPGFSIIEPISESESETSLDNNEQTTSLDVSNQSS